MKIALAKKLGMTTVYEEGVAQNVTLLEIGKNVVSAIRSEEKDGYIAVQISLMKDEKKVEKAVEFRLSSEEEVKEFEKDKELEMKFEKGDKVELKGISKGKGYQGVVKRHGFKGSPASHGHRHDLRAPGSIGSAFPERVMKGKKMAGRMGSDSVTLKGVKVISFEDNILAVKSAVPGNNGSVVRLLNTN